MPTHLLVTGALLALLFVAFVAAFLVPAIIHWRRLGGTLRRLAKLPPKAMPGDFEKIFSADKALAHLWAEYQDTLHRQYEERDGQLSIAAVRSTLPAESFFSSQSIVDSRLRTEFFKHLPGIFTGLGIIGTFSGLIEGLRQFEVSDNAAKVRESLESLMRAVGEAFLISAAAIAAAMLVTFLEKLILASLYKQAEDIAHRIDANFDGGAGEEYLSRLVDASEASASQSKILKDALVKDLGDILRELSTHQVNASRESTTAIGEVISASIEKSLKAPLDQIASVVKTATGDQSAAAIQMLNDVMVSFSQRLNDLFGSQINGINTLNQQTSDAMQAAVASLHTLIAQLEDSGKRATGEMSDKMAAAIQAMEERQASINAQTQQVIEQIRQSIQNSQSETQQKLQDTLAAVASQMASILATLGDSQAKIFEDNRAREQAMTERASGFVQQLSGSVESAIEKMAASSETMAKSISALSTATASSVEKMHAGAETLSQSATAFALAGDRVNGVIGQASTVTTKLTELSGHLTSSSSALQDALKDYQAQRLATSALLVEVRSIVDLARKEASLTSDVLQRIEASTTKLQEAQKSADDYLDGVVNVLAESSDAFRESVVSTLAKVNHEFHTKLSGAVGLLSAAVQELEVTLGGLPPRE